MLIKMGDQAKLAQGYLATGVWCGVKKAKKDLALLYSEYPATAAGVFTKNLVQGAPVIICREHLRSGSGRGVVVNSGNANTCTGPQGLADAKEMAGLAAQELGVAEEEVFPVSTGVIGVNLPMDKVRAGITRATAQLAADGLPLAAQAILTTDLTTKTIAVSFGPNNRYTLTGLAKGSGMIHPNMATLLAFLLTDAPVDHLVLQDLLRQAVDKTFNMISVDGDTSTNDTVLALANGAAGGDAITPGSPLYTEFQEALQVACLYLAKEIARDGEGASKLITVEVHGAKDQEGARLAARAIAASNLVKTAIYGADANWGRILCAAGYSGAQFNQEQVKIEIMEIPVFAGGEPLPFDEATIKQRLAGSEVVIRVDLGAGPGTATAFGCDFTCDYVKINASYRS